MNNSNFTLFGNTERCQPGIEEVVRAGIAALAARDYKDTLQASDQALPS